MDYFAIKWVHLASVAASYGFFFVRGVWMIRESPRRETRTVRIGPHVVDTVLLASAIALAVLGRQYPLQSSWLTAKVIALVAYIVLGTIALKRGRSKGMRVSAWIAAQCVFAYIVTVAITRDPLAGLR